MSETIVPKNVHVGDKLNRLIVINRARKYNTGTYCCFLRNKDNRVEILSSTLLVIGKLKLSSHVSCDPVFSTISLLKQ